MCVCVGLNEAITNSNLVTGVTNDGKYTVKTEAQGSIRFSNLMVLGPVPKAAGLTVHASFNLNILSKNVGQKR